MADKLYRALVNEAIEDRYFRLDDMELRPDDGLLDRLPTGDRVLRGQVRLMIKSLVDVARDEDKNREYQVLLHRVPWCSSRVMARRATNRLLEIAEWAAEADGEEAGSAWNSAAEIASWLMEDYSGWPHRATYLDLSGWYFNALRVAGWNEQNFRALLRALEPKES